MFKIGFIKQQKMVFFSSKMIPKTLAIKLKPPRMAAPMSTLIGPPEIQSFLNQLKMETLPETAAIKLPLAKPPMGCSENPSEQNPCLDFFSKVTSSTRFKSVQARLQKAWNHDPMTSLKLICNLRDFRGTGKSNKEAFYASALWLHQYHPKTLAGNISSMARFGYMKDLPEILYRLLEGSDVRETQKAEWKIKNSSRYGYYTHTWTKKKNKKENEKEMETGQREGRTLNAALKANREMRIFNMLERGKLLKEKATMLRAKKRIAKAKKVLERYHKDSAFRFLYETVSDYFAEHLKADMEHLKSNETRKVSLAAKWCPSLDSSFDRSMLLCESVARKVFPRESYPEYEGLEDAHYAYRVRDRLRKEVLVPLRKALELPEVYMGLNKWGEIQYNRVAPVAMKLYKYKFLKHDGKRFRKFLADGRSRKSNTTRGPELPHEIIKSLKDGDGDQVAELQWKTMVDDLQKQGKLKKCMAISDVSHGTKGTPLEVSVALGLLVFELSEEPWKGKLITFSLNPTLQVVEGESLSQKAAFIKSSGDHKWYWDYIDFEKVFDLILKVAVNENLKEEDMIKRLFVFSGMPLHQACAGRMSYWETDYEVIQKKFAEKGYGNAVPQIVFWNLRDSDFPTVDEGQKGIVSVSGFSKNLLKLFLNGDGYIDPNLLVESAISGKRYQNLHVID